MCRIHKRPWLSGLYLPWQCECAPSTLPDHFLIKLLFVQYILSYCCLLSHSGVVRIKRKLHLMSSPLPSGPICSHKMRTHKYTRSLLHSLFLSLQGYWPCQFSSGWLRSAEMLGLSEEIYGPCLEPRCAEAKVLNLVITLVIVLLCFSFARVMCATATARPSWEGCRQRCRHRLSRGSH